MDDYRTKIYSHYSVQTTISGQTPNKYSCEQWAAAARWYIRGWLPEDKSVPILDLGCGTGYFLWLAHTCGYTNLMGVDLSPEQIAFAKQVCPSAQIVCGDIKKVLAGYKSHFGLIVGFDIIEHFYKNELFLLLESVNNALQPGGRVIFQTPNAGSPLGMSVRYGDYTHELAVTPQGLRSLLAFHGFGDYESHECGPYPHGIISYSRYLLWLVLKSSFTFWNLVETGNKGSGVYTRVFIATARKP